MTSTEIRERWERAVARQARTESPAWSVEIGLRPSWVDPQETVRLVHGATHTAPLGSRRHRRVRARLAI